MDMNIIPQRVWHVSGCLAHGNISTPRFVQLSLDQGNERTEVRLNVPLVHQAPTHLSGVREKTEGIRSTILAISTPGYA